MLEHMHSSCFEAGKAVKSHVLCDSYTQGIKPIATRKAAKELYTDHCSRIQPVR